MSMAPRWPKPASWSSSSTPASRVIAAVNRVGSKTQNNGLRTIATSSITLSLCLTSTLTGLASSALRWWRLLDQGHDHRQADQGARQHNRRELRAADARRLHNLDPVGALQGMAAQRTAENAGADERINIFLPASVEEGRAGGITDIDVLEATDYYRNRCPAEGSGTRMLVSHAASAIAWDAFAFAETLLTQPMMVVFGDKPGGFGAYRDGMEIYGRAASKNKELVVVEGWSHYDLYDNPVPTGIALDRVIPFLKQHLGGAAASRIIEAAE